jgi:hypothetical protein
VSEVRKKDVPSEPEVLKNELLRENFLLDRNGR